MKYLKAFYISLFALSILLQFYGNAFAQESEGITVFFSATDRNYLPKTNIRIDVTFRNQTNSQFAFTANMEMKDSKGENVWGNQINLELAAQQEFKIPLMVQAPDVDGEYYITVNNDGHIFAGKIPSEKFTVLKPEKAARLSKILVTAPEGENDLDAFIENWGIEAPSISWGQVVLCGKRTWQQYADGDKGTVQLIERALKRSMSVIFLDFGPTKNENVNRKIKLPFSLEVEFQSNNPPETGFSILPQQKHLGYKFANLNIERLNGYDGIAVTPIDMKILSKGVAITPLVRTGNSPYRFPVVEIKSETDKGKLILCQLTTIGRFDENTKPTRNRPDLPAYDPLTVQFILNLISTSVGEDLMK